MPDTMIFRKALPKDVDRVYSLVESVFLEFVAPDFTEEGVGEFMKYIAIDRIKERLSSGHFIFVAEGGDEIAGMIEVRNHDHISLFYVDREHHQKGIGRRLFDLTIEECRNNAPTSDELTVNASLYAEKIYQKLGFVSEGPAKTLNGIVFVPMRMNYK
jgi:GNAT superfamily N-acetyltransferase